ncbi:MAG: prolyl oligopeptidase family serine peptidase [Bacteroidota bacterium]
MKNFLLFVMLLMSIYSCKNDQGRVQFLDTTETSEEVVFRPVDITYPEAYVDSSEVTDYNGVSVVDPYRWLEYDSPSTAYWVQQQQSITGQYFANNPFKQALTTRLTKLWNYERYGSPQRHGDYYYQTYNSGLQNQDAIYRKVRMNDPLELVLDPNTFSTDGTTTLGTYAFSQDNTLLAYQISEGGSDWKKIRVLDLTRGKVLEDTLSGVKFSGISWYKDGFFYSRYERPDESALLSASNEFHQVYYHQVGTTQAEDELIFADRMNPKRNIYTATSSDERFLVLNVVESTSGNAVYFQDLAAEEEGFTPMVETFEHDFELVGNQNDRLLFKTNHKAANNRLIQVSSKNPEERYWDEVLPASKDVLQEVHLMGGKIVAVYIHDASHEVRIFDLKGELQKILELPIGSVSNFSGSAEDSEAFFSFTSFTEAPSIYRLNLNELTANPISTPTTDFDASAYQTEQIWYESYDGTSVPMFVIHKKDLELDGTNPTLLYGYGGFDISILPKYNRTGLNLFPVFLENGGVCAVANIRGGGEFGSDWHKAGTQKLKQNVFDDFQAAAEYLIANKYTSSERLAIYGRSNGGLLVGACMTQRPDLFGVAIPAVGVLDMLRYHQFTIGWAWATDYGRSDDPEMLDYLLSYSPVHSVSAERYPATLITTADHDDRVVPAHSYKFAAAVQANQKADEPVLIRIDANTGHGAGKPTAKRIDEAADVLSFIFYNMEHPIVY